MSRDSARLKRLVGSRLKKKEVTKNHLSPSVNAFTPYLDTQYGAINSMLNLPAALDVLTTRPRAILTSGRNVIVTSIRPYRLTAATDL